MSVLVRKAEVLAPPLIFESRIFLRCENVDISPICENKLNETFGASILLIWEHVNGNIERDCGRGMTE